MPAPTRSADHGIAAKTAGDHPSKPPLLSRHAFVDTDDPSYANEQISQIFAPHDLEVGDPAAPFRALHNHARLGELSLNYILHRPAVTIRARPMRRYYLVLMPQTGRCTLAYGAREVSVEPGSLTVLNPLEPVRFDWGDGCAILALKVERSLLEGHLSARLGRAMSDPVLFEFDAAFTTERCRSFVAFMELIAHDLDRESPALAGSAAEGEAQTLCLSLLIDELPHNYSEALTQPSSPVAPYYVRRVEEFIHLHADRPIAVADMVAVSGVSARSLFKGFSDFRGLGPKAYLKAVRLDRVHAELQGAVWGDRSISDIARAWGFRHLGNFARDYRLRFGNSPSETLRGPRA